MLLIINEPTPRPHRQGLFLCLPPTPMPAIPTTAYSELLTLGYTDRMAARYLRVSVPEAMEGMRQARYRREVEAVNASNYPTKALETWGVKGVPWREVSQRH